MLKMIKALIDFSVNSKVATLNVITVLLVLGYMFSSSFSTVWILAHADKLNQETLKLVFEFAGQNKEIILFTIGFIARGSIEKSKNQ